MNYKIISRSFVALAWAGFVFTMIGMPMPPIAGSGGTTFYDKGVHIIIFGILEYLIILIFKDSKKFEKRIAYPLSFSLAAVFAIFSEYYQAFVPGRDPDMADLTAGIIGIAAAAMYFYAMENRPKQKLLLHICCIGCGAFLSGELKEKFRLALFFHNQNIYPREEYDKRLEEIKKVAKKLKLKVIIGNYDHEAWKKSVKGHEKDKERGERCRICYRSRLEEAARHAKDNNYALFATTLSISPHKDYKAISGIGHNLAGIYGVDFYDRDFKKKDGYKKSVQLSKELGLYRQNYCGCEYSMSYGKCDECR